MNKMTAVRTFAKPGFTPTKRVRIHNNRWYLVTMQNVEHGQGDYVGLGEGEFGVADKYEQGFHCHVVTIKP